MPQFVIDNFNQREGASGGGNENRARFPLNLLKAMFAEWTPERIGFKVSPAISMGTVRPTE